MSNMDNPAAKVKFFLGAIYVIWGLHLCAFFSMVMLISVFYFGTAISYLFFGSIVAALLSLMLFFIAMIFAKKKGELSNQKKKFILAACFIGLMIILPMLFVLFVIAGIANSQHF